MANERKYVGRHSCAELDAAVDQAALVSTKQDALATAQLAAVNSGITSADVEAIQDGAFLAANSGSKDRSTEILEMLTAKGECNLGEGTFYVRNLEMPVGTTLRGRGKNTVVRLNAQNVDADQYCIRIHRNNTVEGICFSGGTEPPDDIFTIDTDLGKQHGIYLVENSDGQGQETRDGSRTNMIHGCFFENFDGSGIFARNTGIGMDRGMLVESCFFTLCKVGINIDYYSEYNRFTNCSTYQCNIGCINCGGNNYFANCAFHGTKGFVIDNTNDDKTNNSHGSAVGCTFNHCDNMNNPSASGGGKGIEIINAQYGYTFNACQIWYNEVSIHNSRGIQLTDCYFQGSPVITVTGDEGVTFSNCTFGTTPTITVNDATKFVDCYFYDKATSTSGRKIDPPLTESRLVNETRKNFFKTATASSEITDVTFTNNNDGTWSTSGTASARRQKFLDFSVPAGLASGRYVLSGCPSGGYDQTAKYCLYLYDYTANERVTPDNNDFGYGFEFSWTPDPTHNYAIIIDIRAGSNTNGLTFKPMLCLKSDYAVSSAFVPYIPSNAELYDMIKALQQ